MPARWVLGCNPHFLVSCSITYLKIMNRNLILLLINGIYLTTGMLMQTVPLHGQDLPFVRYPHQLDDDRFAEWIGPSGGNGTGVYYFRRAICLDTLPGQFRIHLSADNRYRFYVNGTLAGLGPAADDLYHWNYETIDIAPLLSRGENILAAQVWNQGTLTGIRQQSHRTAFILQGASEPEQVANTDDRWVFCRDEGYHFIAMDSHTVGGGYIAGATDSVVNAGQPVDWKEPGIPSGRWTPAAELGKGNHSGLDTWLGTEWLLKERSIPEMEQEDRPIPELLYIRGMDFNGSYNGNLDLEIPPHSSVSILLDNRELTMGYPRLHYSGGSGGKIRIRYQEALFDAAGRKGNRDQWRGKTMKGYYDVILPDGRERWFEPLWIRVFRFIELTVETDTEPLRVRDLYHRFTAYPFYPVGSFVCDRETLGPVWDACWRTARLCALETYMDCPYYEQLQYIGDTRIQALISYYVTGDDRLARNALEQFYRSMQPMGLTQSRYPARGRQIIPPFSLYFISMVHDYHMHRDDPDFVSRFLPGIRFILEWFTGRIDETGMLGPLPFWNHIDGGTGFRAGSPPGIDRGGSAHMSILLASTLDRAAELFQVNGLQHDAERFGRISRSLKDHTFDLCYDPSRGLMAETPDREVFSQHTNSIAILAGIFSGDTARSVARKMLTDSSLIQATLYFRFYLFEALQMAGMGGEMLSRLETWKDFLELGLTTFPEHGPESRSDCHAWSAHPMVDLLRVTCGIRPASPGFRSVLIAPEPGDLEHFTGKAAHPAGLIKMSYRRASSRRDSSGVHFEIDLPGELTGTFVYGDTVRRLVPGTNIIQVSGKGLFPL